MAVDEKLWAGSGVIVGNHFTHWLVVRNHPCRRRIDTNPDGLAIDLDVVTKLDALPNVGGFIVDRNPALHDELLHFQARPHAGLSQHLVQLGRFRHGRQHALGRHQLGQLLVGIELAGDDILKPIFQLGFGSQHLCWSHYFAPNSSGLIHFLGRVRYLLC